MHDSVDDLEAQLRRSTRVRRFAVITVLVLGATIPFGYIWWDYHKVNAANAAWEAKDKAEREAAERLTPAESARLDELVDHLHADIVALRPVWQVATDRDALAAVVAGSEPCQIGQTAPTAQAADSYVNYGSIDGNYFGNVSVATYPAGAPLPPTWIDERVASADQIIARVRSGAHTRSDLETAEQLAHGGPVVFAVTTLNKKPVVIGAKFIPGVIDGTAYVFDPGQRAITCAGTFSVTSRSTIDVTYETVGPLDTGNRDANARGMLARDLDVQLKRAVASALRLVER